MEEACESHAFRVYNCILILNGYQKMMLVYDEASAERDREGNLLPRLPHVYFQ